MRPYLNIGLKNIRANKSRTIITIMLSSIFTLMLVFLTALMDGQHKVMLKNAVELYSGYIQVTHKDFRDNPSLDNLIENANRIVEKLEKDKEVASVSQRFDTFVLFSSDTKSIAAMISGIEPSREKLNSKLFESLHEGKYLENSDTNVIYIGKELANNLKVKIGDTLSFVGTGADYSFCADNVVVKGIFSTGLYEFDSASSFVNKKYFDEVFVSENLANQIIVYPKDTENSQALSDKISKGLDKDLDSKSWEEFMQSLIQAMEVDSLFGYITIASLFIVIFFVILIYTLISVFARIKEIGVLKAIGTKKDEIQAMLLFESSLLSFIGVLIGGVIGASLAYYFNVNPIDLRGLLEDQFKQYGIMSTVLPTEFNPINILRDMFIMFVLCVASTLYPIFRINKYKPIEAINHV